MTGEMMMTKAEMKKKMKGGGMTEKEMEMMMKKMKNGNH